MIARGVIIGIISLILALGVRFTRAAEIGRNDQPIQIKSSELTTDTANRTATFSGKVSARQGDITIYCDRLVIYYSDKEKEVDKVEAFGNVRIIQGNRTGQAGHAVYENRAGKIILDEKPRVYQGEDFVAGDVITYFLDTQKSVVTGGSGGVVRAEIHPKKKEKDGGARP
ncbi:MAG TPA: lipopolysaccharide transport periplasmic protein LptA [Geobacteraceae bacterium]